MSEVPSQTDYERSDAPPRLVAALALGLAATVAILFVALAIAFPQSLGPHPRGPLQPLPPQPRLQTTPTRDLDSYRRSEARRLGGYGGSANGAVRVPIDQAMRQVASEGWSKGK